MNKRTSILLATLLGFSAIASAQSPAAASATASSPAAAAATVPHDVKANKGNAAKKKPHAHRKHAHASASASK